MSAPGQIQPYTDQEERSIRWAACQADERATLERMATELEQEADLREASVKQGRANAEFIRRCLAKAPGVHV